MNDPIEKNLSTYSRRKALSRLGFVALAAYTGPMVSTLSMAHAGSSASAASKPSKASEVSKVSKVSEASEASKVSAASEPSKASVASEASKASVASVASVATGPSSQSSDEAAFKACGSKDLNDPNYVACLAKNGLPTR